MADSIIGSLELVGQTRNVQNNALLQIVRRPPRNLRARDYDPNESGDFAVIYTRYLFSAGDDSLLDTSTGQILDIRVPTAVLDHRMDEIARRAAAAPVAGPRLTEEEREAADLDDFKHGVAPDRVDSPVSFINLTNASGHSTMYVEEQDEYDAEGYHVDLVGVATSTAYDYVDSHNQEEAYDRAYTESFFIDYNSVSPPPGTRSSRMSWSHISPTMVSLARPWPILPPLPHSSGGDQAVNDDFGTFEDNSDVAQAGPNTPVNFADILEGSFMASLDEQLSPDLSHPDLEMIVPSDLGQHHRETDNATSVTSRDRRPAGRPAELLYILHPNGTVEMPTADYSTIPSPVHPINSAPYYHANSSNSPIPPAPASPPPSPIPVSQPDLETIQSSPHSSTEIPRPGRLPWARGADDPPAPTAAEATPTNNTETRSETPTRTEVIPTPAIPIPSQPRPGAPGLKRRKMSPCLSSSSSGAEPENMLRRSRRIKRKPRRKYSK